MPDTTHRILLVEDNSDLTRIMTLLLRSMGQQAEAAHSGGAALEAVRTFAPNLVLVDIGLPDMDGYTLAPLLRRELPGPAVLAAVTGHDAPEDRARALNAGFDHHLSKPLGRPELQALLESLPPPPPKEAT